MQCTMLCFLARPTVLTSMQCYMLANLVWWKAQNKAKAKNAFRPVHCIMQASFLHAYNSS